MDQPTPPTDWIELVLGAGCNCRCRHCPSARDSAGREIMPSREVAGWLRRGRSLGAGGVWFGGGEPTLHGSLVSAVGRARGLGYSRIRLQTNAMRLAYPEYASQMVEAGLGEVSVPILGASAADHDAMTRYPHSHELMIRGARNLIRQGVRVEGDILIADGTAPHLDEALARAAGLGLSAFTFWLVSLHGLDPAEDAPLVPTMTRLVPGLARALDRAETLGVAATTLHTPPCVLPPEYRERYVHAGAWNLLVVTPGQEPFRAEVSPMEGGVYLEGCAGCGWRARCLGLRADYLAVHGGAEFEPIND